MHSLIIWIVGFALGLVHALDPDHLAALGTFVSRNPRTKAAVRFAVCWGAGHALSLLAVTAVVLFFGNCLGPGTEKVLDTMVGLTLIGLGLWQLIAWIQKRYAIHSHPHEGERHNHFHAHGLGETHAQHDHSHLAGFIGVLHGLAGSARFLVLIPIAAIAVWWDCITYVLFFSAGVTVAMIVYAISLGRLFRIGDQRQWMLAGAYRPLMAAISMALGCYWVFA